MLTSALPPQNEYEKICVLYNNKTQLSKGKSFRAPARVEARTRPMTMFTLYGTTSIALCCCIVILSGVISHQLEQAERQTVRDCLEHGAPQPHGLRLARHEGRRRSAEYVTHDARATERSAHTHTPSLVYPIVHLLLRTLELG